MENFFIKIFKDKFKGKMKKNFLFFLLIMVKNILKLTIQKEKTKYFGFKYSKKAVKNAATLNFRGDSNYRAEGRSVDLYERIMMPTGTCSI